MRRRLRPRREPESTWAGGTSTPSTASDANNDPIALTLSTAPSGMTLDPVHGLVDGNPRRTNLATTRRDPRRRRPRWSDRQSFVVNVMTATTNEPPRIVSTPVVTGTADSPTFTTSVQKIPSAIRWCGASSQPRAACLFIPAWARSAGLRRLTSWAGRRRRAVTDGQGGRATQSFTIIVRGGNLPPTISSAPPTQGRVGQVYDYAVRAADADGDALRFLLTTSPGGHDDQCRHRPDSMDAGGGTDGSHDVAVLVDGRPEVAMRRRHSPWSWSPTPLNRPADHHLCHHGSSPWWACPMFTMPTANDPEGDALTFDLLTAPAGMSIDPPPA